MGSELRALLANFACTGFSEVRALPLCYGALTALEYILFTQARVRCVRCAASGHGVKAQDSFVSRLSSGRSPHPTVFYVANTDNRRRDSRWHVTV
jgi:hypothetical protein